MSHKLLGLCSGGSDAVEHLCDSWDCNAGVEIRELSSFLSLENALSVLLSWVVLFHLTAVP